MSVNTFIILVSIMTCRTNGNKIIEPFSSDYVQIFQAIVDLAENFADKSSDNFELIQYSRTSIDINNVIAKRLPNIFVKKLLIETKGIPVKNPTIVLCRNFSDILSLILNMYLINKFPKTNDNISLL